MLCEQCQCLGRNLDDFLTLKSCGGDTFLRQKAILGLVLAQLEHRGVLECRDCCHDIYVFRIFGYKITTFFPKSA